MKVRANGIQMHYELSGRVKDSPTLILSHSLASSLIMWEPQLADLERYFRVLRYDIRGHGQTEAPPGPYTLEQLADDAMALLDSLSIEKCDWIGLSMGGMIGLSAALYHADRLTTLVLCDTAAAVTSEAQPVWEARISAVRDKGMESQVDATMERWFSPAFLQRESRMKTFIRSQILATPASGYIGCAEAIRKLDYLDLLPEIQTRTLIMVGEDDSGTPVSAAQAMNDRIRDSVLVVIPSARHLSNVEQPAAFNKWLLDFLHPS
jgi:3-oxoadipate enol-lactonase